MTLDPGDWLSIRLSVYFHRRPGPSPATESLLPFPLPLDRPQHSLDAAGPPQATPCAGGHIEVDHVTRFRWVQRFTPPLIESAAVPTQRG